MALLEVCTLFDNLSLKFNCLLYSKSEKQQQYIISILDELNSLNYRLPVFINHDRATLLIHQLCSIISPSDVVLTEKCCTLIVSLVSKQFVALEGRTLTFTIEWLIQILKHSNNVNIATLQCLECLIRDNVGKIQELLSELLQTDGILLKIINETNCPNIQMWAAKCIETINYTNEQNENNFEINPLYVVNSVEVFLEFLTEEKFRKTNEIVYCKLIVSSLRGLHSILIQSSDIKKYDLGLFLGIAKYYMTYYLYDKKWEKPEKIMPSNLSVADFKPSVLVEKKGGKMTKQRKQRKSAPHKKEDYKRYENFNVSNNSGSGYTTASALPENLNAVISDSDFSDCEQDAEAKTKVAQGRVRQAALNLLLIIVKMTDKQTMFGYWSSFFSTSAPLGVHNLNHCLLHEPSPRARLAILNVISTFLNGSKLYLSQAETSEKTFAFTPFSMILGSMIQELHKTLCSALKDNSIPLLTQTLKSLALLVQSTPYHRLSPGLITNIISNVKPLIRHRDTTVQVAAFLVLGCVIASEPIVPETLECLQQVTNIKQVVNTANKTQNNNEFDCEIEYVDFCFDEDETIPETNENQHNLPWLLEKCLRNLGVIPNMPKKVNEISVPAPVKLESLQIISVMCRNYFPHLLGPHIMIIAKALEISLDDKYVDLKLHSGRAIDSIGYAMQQNLNSSYNDDESTMITIDKGLQFWKVILNGPIEALLQVEHYSTLKSVGCDCLGSIGPDIFEHLPKEKQLLIITLLFSCTRNEESIILGAAVRALAITVLYPSLREDLGFIIDTASAVTRALYHNTLTVRIKSSWALGNLSDALVLYKNAVTDEELPDILILKLISVCIELANDNNKVKSNLVRALGNLIRLVTNELLKEEKLKKVVEYGIKILAQNSTTSTDMKLRWNSCYAIGNLMKNNILFKESSIWQQSVYTGLIDLVENFRNFKVRINAALALSVPEKRSHYSVYYFQIWKSLLNALDNSLQMEDYSEFKHRDNLIDQLCMTISHLTTFLAKDDLKTLNKILMHHSDSLKSHMNRVQDRLVPEKSNILLKAKDHINKLQLENLSREEMSSLKFLDNAFKQREITF